MSDLWRVPFWNWDRDLDVFNGNLVAKSILMLQHQGDHFGKPPGATSPFIDDYGLLTLEHDMPPIADRYERRQEIFWGPGGEARAAWLLIERAPVLKHEGWVLAQEMLSGVPAHPRFTTHITAVIDRAVVTERESWQKLEALESARTPESVLGLDVEGILVSMCLLTGVAVDSDPVDVVAELHEDLSDDMELLRSAHQRLIIFCAQLRTAIDGDLYILGLSNIHEQMLKFKKSWTTIVRQLAPGRLANEMEFYANRMDKLAREHKRYGPSNREQWAEESAISSLRLHRLVHPDLMLFRKTDEGYVPLYGEKEIRLPLKIPGIGLFLF